MGTKILGTYRLEYANGITQYKNLIEHTVFVVIIKPKRTEIAELEVQYKKFERKEDFLKIQALKKELKGYFGEYWFTNKSPLYEAISTGVIRLCDTQGGNHFCRLTLQPKPCE